VPFIAAKLTMLHYEHVIARFFFNKIMPIGRMGEIESEDAHKARAAAKAEQWDTELPDGEVDDDNGPESSTTTTLGGVRVSSLVSGSSCTMLASFRIRLTYRRRERFLSTDVWFSSIQTWNHGSLAS
jgi:hypothetical protein